METVRDGHASGVIDARRRQRGRDSAAVSIALCTAVVRRERTCDGEGHAERLPVVERRCTANRRGNTRRGPAHASGPVSMHPIFERATSSRAQATPMMGRRHLTLLLQLQLLQVAVLLVLLLVLLLLPQPLV